MKQKILFVSACFALVALFVSVSACTKKDVNLKLTVNAKTDQNDPVADAIVKMDGQVIGTTDSKGQLVVSLKLPPEVKKWIEVKKESDQYYFSPHHANIVVSGQKEQSLTLDAVLYFIPKPTAENSSEKLVENETKSATESTPSASPAHPGDKVEDVPENKVTEAPAATPAEETKVVSNQIKIEKPKETVAETQPKAQEIIKKEEPKKEVAEEPKVEQKVASKEIEKPKQEAIVFTAHVNAAKKPAQGAEVQFRLDSKDELTLGCKTNQKGRCIIKFDEKPKSQVHFVVKKEGFQAAEKSIAVSHKGNGTFNLEQGQSINIYALSKVYHSAKGLEGVDVFVNGQFAGKTDKSGHLNYGFAGKSSNLLTINLKPSGYLPEDFETDFVTSGKMTLVKHFTPIDPPIARLVILKALMVGSLDNKKDQSNLQEIDKIFNAKFATFAKKHMMQDSLFEEYSFNEFQSVLKKKNRTIDQAVKKGWQDTALKDVVDGAVIPSLIVDKTSDKSTRIGALEVSIVDSRGKILSAAKEPLDGILNEKELEQTIKSVALKLQKKFPFEGAVLRQEGDKVIINLGKSFLKTMASGDVFEVYGIQSEEKGQSQTQKSIGTLSVVQVAEHETVCKILKLNARAVMTRGDLVILRPSSGSVASAKTDKVAATSPKSKKKKDAITKLPNGQYARIHIGQDAQKDVPVSQANVYLADQWIGSTDETGWLYADKDLLLGAIKEKKTSSKLALKVIKYGYKATTKETSVDELMKSPSDLKMQKEVAYIRIETKPEGATVKLDGAVLGKTPLISPVSVPTGFAKLTIEGVSGYKVHESVLDLDQGTLDLTGQNAIQLEEDIRASAKALQAKGKFKEAIEKLETIPESHSDYLISRYDVGELYLTKLKEPAKAAKSFGIVTSAQTVKNFNDKRFIGAHINEGIALFFTAESLAATNAEASKAHYQKAIEVLSHVGPQIRFVAKDQINQAQHNVNFYHALAQHKLWTMTKDQNLLVETVRSWRDYLEGTAKSVPAQGDNKTYVENAKVYFGQAKAYLASASKEGVNE